MDIKTIITTIKKTIGIWDEGHGIDVAEEEENKKEDKNGIIDKGRQNSK